MWHYIKYVLKLLTGFLFITAMDVFLKKTDPNVGDWWFYLTLIFYNGYCYLEFRLSYKDE